MEQLLFDVLREENRSSIELDSETEKELVTMIALAILLVFKEERYDKITIK